MSKANGSLARLARVTLSVAALCGALAATASANWLIEGKELKGTAALATTAKLDENVLLTVVGLTVRCTGNLDSVSPEIKSPVGIAAASLIFTGCSAETPCTVPTTLGTVPILGQGHILKPTTGTVFTTIKVTGAECASAGNKPLTGDFEVLLTDATEERTAQPLEVEQAATGLLKLGSSPAFLSGIALLQLASGKLFSCPL